MIAAVFPGQGSQKPGMGRELYETFADAREVFERAGEATGLDLPALLFESDDDTLRQTQNAQLALYVAGLAAFRSLPGDVRDRVQVVAGHSVGEYAALAAAEAVSIEDGARLVRRRGELMAESGRLQPGTMAAVLGLDREKLEAVCSAAPGVVVVANDNCPGQLVISGEVAAVEAAGKLASEAGAKRVLPLNVSGAFHSPLMEEPARRMGEALRAVTWHQPTKVLIANVTAAPMADGFADSLEQQLLNPVRWTESVERMLADGVDTFVECGVGEVLSGLVKRISKEPRTLRVNDAATREETLAALAT